MGDWIAPKMLKSLKSESMMFNSIPNKHENEIYWWFSGVQNKWKIGAYVHKYDNIGDIDIWTDNRDNVNINISDSVVSFISASDYLDFSREEMHDLYKKIVKYIENKED